MPLPEWGTIPCRTTIRYLVSPSLSLAQEKRTKEQGEAMRVVSSPTIYALLQYILRSRTAGDCGTNGRNRHTDPEDILAKYYGRQHTMTMALGARVTQSETTHTKGCWTDLFPLLYTLLLIFGGISVASRRAATAYRVQPTGYSSGGIEQSEGSSRFALQILSLTKSQLRKSKSHLMST